MKTVKRRRRQYRSPLRQQQAADTRSRIVAAAYDLFVQNGYIATSIDEVAAQANVSPRMVYVVFGSKIELLRAVRESRFSPEGPRPRGWIHPAFQAVFEEPDIAKGIRLYARLIRQAVERTAELASVLIGAAAAEPEVADLLAEGRQNHLQQSRRYARYLSERGALRADISVEAAGDTLYTITGHEPYARLVRERGWSAQRYEGWTADSIARLLVDYSFGTITARPRSDPSRIRS